MKAKKKPVEQKSFLLPTPAEQLDARRPIYQLAGKIPWGDFQEEFGAFYSEEGRPAKPVRLMVGLLILKQLHDLGDETVVEAWRENFYWQYFCGESEMQWGAPCEPSDLVHFRHRIGEAGGADDPGGVHRRAWAEGRGKGSGDRLDGAGEERDLSDRRQALPQGHRALLEAGRQRTNPVAPTLSKRGAKMPLGPDPHDASQVPA